MNVTGTNATTSGQTATGAASTQNAAMGQDAFLRLLLTQLQHQDPTQPMADTEFIAQLAQFSALEKLTEISASVKTLVDALGAQAAASGTGEQA